MAGYATDLNNMSSYKKFKSRGGSVSQPQTSVWGDFGRNVAGNLIVGAGMQLVNGLISKWMMNSGNGERENVSRSGQPDMINFLAEKMKRGDRFTPEETSYWNTYWKNNPT